MMERAGLVCACLAMVWLGAVVRRPFLVAAKMTAENELIARRVENLKHDNEQLRKEAAALQSPQGMEREARRLGYVREGEVPLIIPK